MSKITKATLKSFVRKNNEKIFVNVRTSFDGMVDGCEPVNSGFIKAKDAKEYDNYNLGKEGIELTCSTRNWFDSYEDENFKGIEVSNCCGRFIVAIQKGA